jgi:hypothetical protein
MAHIDLVVDNDLYRDCPAYRVLADELFRLQQAYGALAAAYANALNDQQRMRDDVQHTLNHLRTMLRDDPGIGGSGGA